MEGRDLSGAVEIDLAWPRTIMLRVVGRTLICVKLTA
jgi:hypothetical protein